MQDEGFGSRLARATVKGQFGGEIVRDWRPEGLVIRLTVDRQRLTDCSKRHLSATAERIRARYVLSCRVGKVAPQRRRNR